MSTQKQKFELFSRLAERGFTYDEAQALRRIEMTLHRWAEQECGDSNSFASFSIERDEKTNKPFRCVYPHNEIGCRRYPIADREAGALKRLSKIMESHPDFVAYHQTDPRGCALYIVRKTDYPSGANAQENRRWLEQYYTRGLAVCA